MEKELFRRRNLPHWDVPHSAYFVTSCLEGSIPAEGWLDVQSYRAQLDCRPNPSDETLEQSELRKWKLQFARVDTWLDTQPANCILADERLAGIVVNSMFHFAAVRYYLIAFVVMPSHIHWLFQPRPEWVATLPTRPRKVTPREKIMYSFSRWTANQCHRVLHQRGRFWQGEPYDHWVRDADEMERIIHYIEANPVKARLVDAPEQWSWSSAAVRHTNRLEFGCPLLKDHWLAMNLSGAQS
jgi:REP element-mobilizing transposase RayT